MTITRLCHVWMTTAMVKMRTKVAETTGSQVVITEVGKEMTVLTIINNLRMSIHHQQFARKPCRLATE